MTTCDTQPSTKTTLQKLGQQTDKAQTDDGRVDVDVDGSAARVAASGGAVASGAASVGLLVVGGASELALDDTVATLGAGSELLQLSASVSDVVGGRQREGTLDVLECGEFNAGKKPLAIISQIVIRTPCTYLLKLPPSLIAPPSSARSGKPVTSSRAVLLTMVRAPPRLLRAEKVMLVS